MKTIILNGTLIICLFAVFSCKKTGNANTPVNYKSTNCELATEKGGYSNAQFYYNSKYMVLAIVNYSPFFSGPSEDSFVFQYNGLSQLVEIDDYDRLAAQRQWATFSYNTAGNVIQYINGNSTDNYTYDSKGNIIIDSTYVNSALDSVSNFQYDAVGNIIDLKTYTNNGAFKDHSVLVYDHYTNSMINLPLPIRLLYYGFLPYCSNKNNITKITSYNSGIIFSASYTYNNEGLPITEAYTNGNLNFTYYCH